MKTTKPLLEIDRSVFQKSDEERVALRDMKRQLKQRLQAEHGDNWKKRFHNPVKL